MAFGLCLILAAIVGATAVSRMAQMNYAADMLNSDSVSGLKGLQAITSDCKQFRLLQYKHILETDNAQMLRIEADMSALRGQVDKDISDYQTSAFQDEDKANIVELKNRWSAYMAYFDQLLDLSHKNNFKAASALIAGPMGDAFSRVTDQLDTMSTWNAKRAETLSSDASKVYDGAKITVIGLLTVAIILGIFMAVLVTKIITSNLTLVSDRLDSLSSVSLSNLGSAVDSLAVGDLTAKVVTGVQPLEVQANDEFGALAKTVNTIIARADLTVDSFVKAQSSLLLMARAADEVAEGSLIVTVKPQSDKDILGNAIAKMIANLSTLVAQVRTSSESIGQASLEVASGNEDLSQRTSEQASSLEETASSMEEMTATVKQNADSSRQANQLAAQARDVAEKGGSIVGKAVSSMEEINRASKRIADIISVIDEIAFQTNLLALNAAVEAARVGEQGRGFAVVAAEVRNLAGRSSTAAKEIKSLVQDSVVKVQEGSELVNQSGQQLDEIVSSVKKVADIIQEISAASQEQSAGIEQVNRAIMQMDQITQQNAALVEEASAASQSMNQQAKSLQNVVGRFKLDESYLRAAEQQANLARTRTAVNHATQAATGTHGRTVPTKRTAKPDLKLSVVDKSEEGFEEF